MRYILLTLLFFITVVYDVRAIDTLTAAQRIAAQGMQVQNERLKVISQNIANSNSTGVSENEEPYRRKIIMFKNEYDPVIGAESVKVGKIANDKSGFNLKFEPHHPAADSAGYVRYPNVNIPLETVDAKEAQRTYEANLSALDISKSNQLRILEAMK